MNAYDDHKKTVAVLDEAKSWVDGPMSASRNALRQIIIVKPKTSAEIIGFGSDYLDEEDQKLLSVTDIAHLVEAVDVVSGYEYGGRDKMSQICMDLSLCPIHTWDWAICFDDEPIECAQVRTIFPNSHDT